MELGFQDKKKFYTFLASMLLLIFAVVYAFNNRPGEESAGTGAAPAAVSKPAAHASPQTAADYRRQRRREAIDIYSIDPTIHVEKLEQSAVANYTTTKRNLFRYEAAPPPPPPKKTPQQLAEEKRIRETPPPPPPPPPIELRYYGFATDSGTKTKKVFLTNGQDIFIAGEGEIVANRYKIIRIGVNSVEVEDLRNRSRQQLPLTEG